jgi:hypothetical protein
MLGISIGVGAFLCSVAVGQGAALQIEAQIRSLGENFIWLEAGNRNVNGVRTGTHGTQSLTLRDMHALRMPAPAHRAERQHIAAVGRRVNTLCKGEGGLQQQLLVFHCYYNFCLPHTSLRRSLPQPEPTNGSGSATQWRPCTPAMAAGLTDHVWSLREMLLFRVPPWPQPAGV